MSKQDKPSKKAVREKKASILEDQTFGLKNKNKSKKVQQFISRVEKTVKHSNGGGEAEKAKELKKESKLAKQLQEEELRLLFNEGITNQFGKKKSKTAGAAAALGLNDANKEVADFLEAMSSDSDEDSDDGRNGPIYINTVDEQEPTEVFREKTIEDIIEEQRQKLAAEGKVGTPVTEVSFAKWRAAKLLQRQAEAEARVKAEQMKRKGGKGLSVLSGKELFSYNASLFVDDDAAIDASDEKSMQVEAQRDAAREEALAKEESDRIQAEQQRLFEIQQIEFEVRRQKEEERRRAASAANRVTFVMNGVTINQVVFEEDEIEDLSAFPEEKLVEAIERVATDISTENLNYNEEETEEAEEETEEAEEEEQGESEGEEESDGDEGGAEEDDDRDSENNEESQT